MLLACIIVVWQNEDAATAEMLVELTRPFAGALARRGGHKADRGQAICILLAFDDVDGIIWALRELGQAVRDLRPWRLSLDPGVAIPVALPELFGVGSLNSEIWGPVRLSVDVLGDYAAASPRMVAISSIGRTTIGFPFRHSAPLADVVFALDGIVAREAVNDDLITLELDGKRTILG
jgi:hypothetical protein